MREAEKQCPTRRNWRYGTRRAKAPITLSDCGRSAGARTLPPIWRRVRSVDMSSESHPNWLFCVPEAVPEYQKLRGRIRRSGGSRSSDWPTLN